MVQSSPHRSRHSAVYRRSRKHSGFRSHPFVAFLLVASFGILFAGCGQPQSEEDTFTFTEDDVARFREVAGEDEAGSGATTELSPVLTGQTDPEALPKLDLSMAKTYDAVRSGPAAAGEETYRVTNAYLNVRAEPKVTATEVARLTQGDTVEVRDFMDAAWAKVSLGGSKEGYVSTRYIAKLVSEEQLSAERKKYDGVYFVDFGFLNVRKAADAGAEKLGELPGQALVRPISSDKVWARIPFGSGEGYVAVQYLSPFSPQFLVRQDSYRLPIIHYRMSTIGFSVEDLPSHVTALRNAGVTLWTFKDLRQLVLSQEQRDVRVPPTAAILAISDVTAENVQKVAQALKSAGVPATLFIRTAEIGLSGINEKTLLTLLANGHDIQSGGHTGDDLRSLTNAQMELELSQSRALLEEMTGKPVFAIGYPIGGVNDRVIEIAGKQGYLFGVGSSPESTFSRSQFLRLPSFVVSESMTADDIIRTITGKPSALRMRDLSPRSSRPRGQYLAFA
ncbi:hypothetical protein FJZ27_03160 [Candidatus Peribacteria bacterium]|nr:hypothetical protein [Candidatus Peribacteria bacterium]